jgi:hypothetical protein
MQEPCARFPARAPVEIVVHASEDQIEAEVLGDVLIVELDRSSVDDATRDIRLIRHHHQGEPELLQALA